MAKNKRITAYLLRVDEKSRIPYKGYLTEVENSLEAEQYYVNYDRSNGIIQVITLDGIDYILHDESKLLGFPPNRVIVGDKGEVLDIIAGNIMCVRHNADGDFTSILKSDIDVIEKRLRPIFAVIRNTVFIRGSDDLPEYKEGD